MREVNRDIVAARYGEVFLGESRRVGGEQFDVSRYIVVGSRFQVAGRKRKVRREKYFRRAQLQNTNYFIIILLLLIIIYYYYFSF